VNFKALGNIVVLHFQDSGKYAAVVNQPVLCRILAEYSVKFDATLTITPTQNDKESGRQKKKSSLFSKQQECSIHIVIYGSVDDRSAVGDLLSGAGLYLQQPFASECDKNIEYSNPHYLIRPGSQMPSLEDSSIRSDLPGTTASERLDEVSRSRLTQLFDTADDSGVHFQLEPSSRLRSSLKP
jgi:hypothetical protein